MGRKCRGKLIILFQNKQTKPPLIPNSSPWSDSITDSIGCGGIYKYRLVQDVSQNGSECQDPALGLLGRLSYACKTWGSLSGPVHIRNCTSLWCFMAIQGPGMHSKHLCCALRFAVGIIGHLEKAGREDNQWPGQGRDRDGGPHGEAVIRTYLREGMSSEWKHTRDCQTLVPSIGFTCPEGDSFLLDLASEP